MDNLKEALAYVAELAKENEKTEVVEICGKTYANKSLKRYDTEEKASALKASTLSSLVDYIVDCREEFKNQKMILHIVSPKEVCLISFLNAERERESLFSVQAETSEFRFDSWYDQERFMIELQANFEPSEDLAMVMKAAGNIEKKNEKSFSDDGITQVATMTVGVAAKADVIVPNPVELIPFRTFQEVAQPASKFVFRMGDIDEPAFKIVEAEGGIWKNEAIRNIKDYLSNELFRRLPEEDGSRIVIIG